MAPPLPTGRFTTIVADPPWTYRFATRTSESAGTGWHGAAQRHYSTMTTAQIRQLPVADLADDNAVLWLWAVNPMITTAIDLADHWGFTYKGILTWAKTQKRHPDRPAFG